MFGKQKATFWTVHELLFDPDVYECSACGHKAEKLDGGCRAKSCQGTRLQWYVLDNKNNYASEGAYHTQRL